MTHTVTHTDTECSCTRVSAGSLECTGSVHPGHTVTHWTDTHSHPLDRHTQSHTGQIHRVTHWTDTHSHTLDRYTVTHWTDTHSHTLDRYTESHTGQTHSHTLDRHTQSHTHTVIHTDTECSRTRVSAGSLECTGSVQAAYTLDTQSHTGQTHTVPHWTDTHSHTLDRHTQSHTGQIHRVTHWTDTQSHTLDRHTQSRTQTGCSQTHGRI